MSFGADLTELEEFNAELIEHRSNAAKSCAEALYGQVKSSTEGVLMQGGQVTVIKTSDGARLVVRKHDPSL